MVLISKLPWYYDGCYTEKDLAELLKPFGFQHNDDNIYVLPQAHKVGARSEMCVVCFPSGFYTALKFDAVSVNFYIIVVSCFLLQAFALMQVEKLHRLISGRRWIFLRKSRLFFGVVTVEFLISPVSMQMTPFQLHA